MKYLTHLYIIIFCLTPIIGNAQYCTLDNRFTEVNIFDQSQIVSAKNLVYGNANDWEGNPQDLLMDIFYPSMSVDVLIKRPFILIIHGGGFFKGKKDGFNKYCLNLARKGYVAATISYRLGWDTTSVIGQTEATYRAQQDAAAALRYIVENADTYKIDTDWMFIGGQSAGAITSLNTVFVNEAEWESIIPGIVANLGNLNTSGNNLTHSFDIKAVYNDCGMTNEMAIKPEDMVPIISFHGYRDNTVPIGRTAGGTAGSAIIHQLLLANGVCSELTVDSLGGHCPFDYEFMLGRTACFFKSILCSDCSSNYLTDEIPADCSNMVPLPIRLVYFNAIPTDSQKVRLEWQTASETNNIFFTIERSVNASDWEVVTTIDGAGNSSTLLSYTAIDNNPYLGISYYRLKQTDFDGQFEYFSVKSIYLEEFFAKSVEIYPNPTDARVTVMGSKSELLEVRIMNLLGQEVSNLTTINNVNESTLLIDLSHLTNGMYYVKTRTTTKKVCKQ